MSGRPLTPEQYSKKIHDHIDRMPSLSTTVTKVLEICNKPNTSPNDLNRVISLDPVLTGQVLKLINSAYYSLPNQITSLTRAIIMLGLNTVKNLALSTAILGTMKKESFQGLSMDVFWSHSLCVGVTAKALAEQAGVPAALREEYFVAGLLHDLGKIPLSSCFAEEYAQVLELARLEQCALYRAESMVVGLDHGQVGRMIAEKWQLNEPLLESLACHHDTDQASEASRDLVMVVSLANMFTNMFEVGTAGDFFPEGKVLTHLLEVTGIAWSELAAMNETVQGEIDKAQIFLQTT